MYYLFKCANYIGKQKNELYSIYWNKFRIIKHACDSKIASLSQTLLQWSVFYSKVKKNHFMNKFNVSFLNLSDIKSTILCIKISYKFLFFFVFFLI